MFGPKSPRHRLLGTLAVSTILSFACAAEELPEATETASTCVGKCDGLAASGTLPVALRSTTWDGRVVIGSGGTDPSGCRVMAVRPERIQVQGDSVQLPPAVFSGGVPCGTELQAHAIAQAPGHAENPYRSDASGEPDPEGNHWTYAMVVVSPTDGDEPVLTSRRASIVVADPDTPDADVTSLRWETDPVELRTPDGRALAGTHPTATADGGLLVFVDGDSDALVYARPVDPRSPDSAWTAPAPLTRLFEEADVMLDGVRLAEHYPLAARQLRGPDGGTLEPGEPYFGAYPWISQDGADLFHTSAMAGNPARLGERGRRGAVSVIGRGTGHAMRHLDGPINPTREAITEDVTIREFHVSPGRSRSFFAPYREIRSIPRNPHAPAYPVFASVFDAASPFGSYHEVDFEVFADRDYVLYLPMNESISTAGDFAYDLEHTPDISGNFNTAELLDGAAFPFESLGTDSNPGPRGRAMYFTDGGALRVESSPTLVARGRGLSVSLFVQRLEAVEGARSLIDWSGVARLELDEDGFVDATVFVDGEPRTVTADTAVPMNAWTHVALTYDGVSGTLRTYVGGDPAGQDRWSRGMPSAQSAEVIVGPSGTLDASASAILALDEVALSRVARNDADIAWAARREPPMVQTNVGEAALADVMLPLGLDPGELRIPPWGPLRTETIELGRRLFFDPRLSRTGEVSCATCHDPTLAFTDGRAVGEAIDGTDLTRASPTIFNRALSDNQFWDGRARTLEAQALSPIMSPREMNFTIEETVALVRSSSEYVERFEAAFGRAPDRNGITNALAAFQRAMLAGDSPVDRFEAGELDALTAQEQRGRLLFHGKARCIACHNGSNYADEMLHRIGLFEGNDRGAFFVSGGRTALDRAFKTPTLRNIDVTGPYFHDGHVETLEEVVELYDDGATLPGHDWEIRPLGLTADERADLVAFLRALTSPNATTATTPPELPVLDL